VNPNALAWIALYGWPLVALLVFAARRGRARLARTTTWMLLLPVMFLPSGIELPFGGLTKTRIAVLSAAAALLLFHRRELRAPGRWRLFPELVLAVSILGITQTVLTNADPLSFGVLKLPGQTARDGIWMVFGFVVENYLPFAIGQRVFKTERDLRDLLEVLTTCVLVYAPLCLFEARFSPQLSNWVYGYFPHAFSQAIRAGGYRPFVFMSHGLAVAMFMFTGLCASLSLNAARVRLAARPTARARAAIAGLLLALSKSLASIIYAGVTSALVVWTSGKAMARAAVVIAIVVAAYPLARAYQLIPTEQIVEAFSRVSAERAFSLQFRFQNEDALIKRAMERPAFGWGSWGRNRIYEWWGEPGDDWADYRDASITDGTWIIAMGISGLVGFGTLFALLLVPLARFAVNQARYGPTARTLLGALALMLAMCALDLLPNSQSDYLPLFYAGAVFTLSGQLRRRRAAARVGPAYAAAASGAAPPAPAPVASAQAAAGVLRPGGRP
jgi:hypothetical protein